MTKSISKTVWIPIFTAFLASACGYTPQANDQGPRTLTDNRGEYMIQRQTSENEYMDKSTTPHNTYLENVNPTIDTRITDERNRAGISSQARQAAEYDIESTMKSKVMQISGIRDAEVNVQGTNASIRIQPEEGTDREKLEEQVRKQIRLLYNFNVQVTSY
ncbi:hypothetical protein [Ammoniphilus sp. CFH 90114]|uniref:hypothetical protein n=1 Tax=Ammoniphilus sp. CFH 90114 TaxID=2493665 RepID=UPI00100DC754|nr:hypothetical protein [Ammoniphilus sp. CFH 90114]RXT15306.1 hypothetical protein EIZ39_03620 [Ammoniphilus sp. CFH 90114]